MFQNLQLTKQNFIDSNWESFIDKSIEPECHHYSRIFKDKADEVIENNSKEVFILLSAICSFYLKQDSTGSSSFQAAKQFADSRSAIPEDIPEEYWGVLNEISGEIQNSEIRARVFDLLWSCQPQRNGRAIKPAIKAYLETAEIYLCGSFNPIESVDRIRRAVELYKYDRSQREPLIKFIKTQIEDDKYKKEQYPVVFLHLIEILIELSAEGLESYVEDLENLAEKAPNTLIEEGLYRAIHNLLPKDNNKVKSNFYKIKAAQTYAKEAEKAASSMATCKFLTQAIEALNKTKNSLNEIEVTQQVESLKNSLSNHQKSVPRELKILSTEFDISQQAQKAQQYVSNKATVHDALFALIQVINIPTESHYQEIVKNTYNKSPLMFLFPASQLNSNGQTVGVVPPLFSFSDNKINQESLKFHSFFSLNIDLGVICSGYIQPAIHQISLEHRVDLNTFLEIVQNNPFVEPGRELIYAKGLLAGFNQDLIMSTHLLIPQFENSIRHILHQHGEITTKLDDSKEFEKEMSLNELFFHKQEILKKFFYENQLFVMEYLLVNPLGANLRNLFAHGLFHSDQFYSSHGLYLWGLILQLIYLPLLKRE